MASFKFIHAADIHLDSPLSGLSRYEGAPVDQLRNATRRAFENLIQLALDEQVQIVLIAGDLYDGDWRDYHTGLYFIQQINRLKSIGASVYMVRGNHDAQSKISRYLELPDHVHLFRSDQPESVQVDDFDLVIHGQSFAEPEVKTDLSLNYPPAWPHRFNIGLLHTAVSGDAQHQKYAPCTLSGLKAKGYDYWALGHVHQKKILSSSPWIGFSGNIQGRHIRENGAKGCLLVEVASDQIQSVSFKALDVVRWFICSIDITGLSEHALMRAVSEQFQSVLDRSEGRLAAVRIKFKGYHPDLKLQSNQIDWLNRFRGQALNISAKIWLEKIEWPTENAPASQDQDQAWIWQTVQNFEPFACKEIERLNQQLSALNLSPWRESNRNKLLKQAAEALIEKLNESD